MLQCTRLYGGKIFIYAPPIGGLAHHNIKGYRRVQRKNGPHMGIPIRQHGSAVYVGMVVVVCIQWKTAPSVLQRQASANGTGE